jgi:hypothetical protein
MCLLLFLTIFHCSQAVICKYEPLRRRINAVLEMAVATIDTLADSYEVTSQTAAQQVAEVKEDTKDIIMASAN